MKQQKKWKPVNCARKVNVRSVKNKRDKKKCVLGRNAVWPGTDYVKSRKSFNLRQEEANYSETSVDFY
jgi:hypothetical protein